MCLLSFAFSPSLSLSLSIAVGEPLALRRVVCFCLLVYAGTTRKSRSRARFDSTIDGAREKKEEEREERANDKEGRLSMKESEREREREREREKERVPWQIHQHVENSISDNESRFGVVFRRDLLLSCHHFYRDALLDEPLRKRGLKPSRTNRGKLRISPRKWRFSASRPAVGFLSAIRHRVRGEYPRA